MHDPGIGFVTLTRVQVSPTSSWRACYYTALGDDTARRNSARALERAAAVPPASDRHAAAAEARPRAEFVYDESIAGQDRIEQFLNEIQQRRQRDTEPGKPTTAGDMTTPMTATDPEIQE